MSEVLRVVLIEDDLTLNETLVDFLQFKKYSVESFDNASEALAYLEENQNNVDIIISDIMMEGMDGLTLLKKIKTKQHLKNIPFIFISAKASADFLREGMEGGANDYLFKPFKNSDLDNAIQRVVNAENIKNLSFLKLKAKLNITKQKNKRLNYLSNHIVRKHITNAQGIANLFKELLDESELADALISELNQLEIISRTVYNDNDPEIKALFYLKNILIIDDDKISLYYNKRIIETVIEDAEISIESDPEKAIEYIIKNKEFIDLLVVDYKMPKINGIQLIEKLKDESIDIPSILASYNVVPLSNIDLNSLNIVDVWVKPVSKEMIEEFINSRSSQAI